jgi:alkaline phosphatase D
VIAAEFVGTSISSGGNGTADTRRFEALKAENAGLRFYNAQRGYVRCTVTPAAWRSDYVVVEDVTKPGAPAINKASFVVEAGKAGVQSA